MFFPPWALRKQGLFLVDEKTRTGGKKRMADTNKADTAGVSEQTTLENAAETPAPPAAPDIGMEHLLEAVQYRRADNKN